MSDNNLQSVGNFKSQRSDLKEFLLSCGEHCTLMWRILQ